MPREHIILGNGSNEIIEFIGHAFLRARRRGRDLGKRLRRLSDSLAALFGAETVEVPDRDMRFDLEALLAAITRNTRVIFIANPNNPTGTLVSQEAIDRFMARVPDESWWFSTRPISNISTIRPTRFEVR